MQAAESETQAKPKNSQIIQQQYIALCQQMGDFYFKLEALKGQNAQLQEAYLKALAEEASAKN